jgi:hypothetical protein
MEEDSISTNQLFILCIKVLETACGRCEPGPLFQETYLRKYAHNQRESS